MSSLISNHNMNSKKHFSKGFTLIELMVTVGIFVFMTGLLLSKYNSFYSGTIFTNLAYDIAITIRQAQSYGLSVRVDDPAKNNFNAAYGVHFDSANPTKFSLNSYTLDPTSHLYKITGVEKSYSIKQGVKVSVMCGNTDPAGGTTNCTTLSSVDIVFQRPKPEAIICSVDISNGYSSCIKKYVKITLTLGNDSSVIRTIEANSVGQISVR